MAEIFRKWLSHVEKGLSMLEIASIGGKMIEFVGIDLYMLEIAWVIGKRLKYMANVQDIWEMA